MDFHDIRAAAFDLPARFVSWSHKVKKFVNMDNVQRTCLTTAIYFEARSESALGQLAVATVVLNRVQKSKSSICGIVYQGSDHLNACQFSFACDGNPEVVNEVRAWKTASEVSEVATAGNTTKLGGPMQLLASATNYHADYVDPYWAKSLNRLTKIGRHIFYSQG
ncbi:MAG TPA: cell wall hydrolase [Aestuariivirga sp.]|nr:cell wall hydrolase [Aestuariivirga sp.]